MLKHSITVGLTYLTFPSLLYLYLIDNKILLNDQEKSQVKSSPLFRGTGVVESVEALHTKDK